MRDINIKIDLSDKINNGDLSINLGCGTTHISGYINIDYINDQAVDIVADLENGLPFLPDNSVKKVISKSFFEHIENLDLMMEDLHRVVKNDGEIEILVPHFANPYYYSDPTHKRFFGLYTFDYWAHKSTSKRKVPPFYFKNKFIILRKKYKYVPIFFVHTSIKRRLISMINLHPILQEIFEEKLVWLISPSHIVYTLKPHKP